MEAQTKCCTSNSSTTLGDHLMFKNWDSNIWDANIWDFNIGWPSDIQTSDIKTMRFKHWGTIWDSNIWDANIWDFNIGWPSEIQTLFFCWYYRCGRKILQISGIGHYCSNKEEIWGVGLVRPSSQLLYIQSKNKWDWFSVEIQIQYRNKWDLCMVNEIQASI